MSEYFAKNGKPYRPVFGESKTKQSFKDSTDVNKILARYAQQGDVSHLQKFGGEYGDFSGYDFDEHQRKLARGRELFDSLSPETRREFGHSPKVFFEFVNDPENVDRLDQVIPQIAAPGRYFPDVSAATPPAELQTTPIPESAETQPAGDAPAPDAGD